MPRFQVLVGKHYQREKHKDPHGNEFESEFEYSANDATCNVVNTDLSVDGPIDLEERYNQGEFSRKFRRLPDAQDEIKGFDDDAFRQEAIRRGYIKEGDVSVGKPPETTMKDEVHAATKKGAATGQPHPALQNLGKMPLIGMQKLAEDEEIDISGCKDEQQTRKTIEAALKARK